VQEQASLLSFQHALIEQRDHEERLAQLNTQLRAAAALEAEILGSGAPGALLTLRMTLDQLNNSMSEARNAVASAEAQADRARSRWEHDKSELSAVEQLLERRAEERRIEADRQAARAADDQAAQAWMRQRTAESGGDHSA
jgi:flagellar export protein FliJ